MKVFMDYAVSKVNCHKPQSRTVCGSLAKLFTVHAIFSSILLLSACLFFHLEMFQLCDSGGFFSFFFFLIFLLVHYFFMYLILCV